MLLLIIAGIILLAGISLIIWAVSIYNRFFSLKNTHEATLGQIRVALKKRLDMIEQLLGAVHSYATFEKETLQEVTKLRASVGTAGPGDIPQIEAESRNLLGRLIAVMENYPDLKTSQTVLSLMDSVKQVEDEIARQRYTANNVAEQFNTMIDTIPSNIIGRMIGLLKLPYLEFAGEDIEKRPDISF